MSQTDDILLSLESNEETYSIPSTLTILPLRDIIIFPNMIFPVLIGRTSSLKSVAESVERNKYIFLTAQKNPNTEEPNFKDIYQYGTIAKILQIIRLPNNLLKVLVEGLIQAKIKKQYHNEDFMEAELTPIETSYNEKNKELVAIIRHSSELFVNYIKENKNLPPDLIGAFENIDDPVRKLYFAAANVQQNIEVKQKILQKRYLKQQYLELASILSNELEMLKIEDEIDSRVNESIQKTQKKFYIQEQIRALQKELGEDDDSSPEIAQLRQAIIEAKMPEEIHDKAIDELDKLKKTPQMSPEYSVNRNYLELLTTLPWTEKTEDNLNIDHVKNILDEDHYDLQTPKDRILEFIAILNLSGSLKKQILCFVGPPGVGKTSLARSIARALGRQFVRFSLGGVRDEAEIRGHRRTYIGAMPGKIIQSMKKAKTTNPVILLDEIDKMTTDFRGDPSSALLEVLDPEQNIAFNDHYLEIDYDLSNVMFITTANVKYDIPLPLQDRMEIIELSSYLEPDKIEIAKRHIIPNTLKEFSLDQYNISISDQALTKIIQEYTKEAGVRQLERTISSVLRKFMKQMISDFNKNNPDLLKNNEALKDNNSFIDMLKNTSITIDSDDVHKFLKSPKYKSRKEDLLDRVGVATGLAWTSVGGDILPVEISIMPGSEKLTLTGKLGDVMKESAMAALSYIRSDYERLNIQQDFYKKKEIHVHVPEGAIPKDGPSAGITIATTLLSAISGKAVRGDLAMTGEITLRGNILPIGGLKEKLLAAQRYGYKTVLIPKENEKDLDDVRDTIKKDLEIIPVSHFHQAIEHIFVQDTKTIVSARKSEK